MNVRILHIIDTPIKFIDEHSFLGVNRTLQELHIIGSKLEKFPNQAIQILGNLTILIIRGNRLESMNDESFHGSLAASKIERIEISNGNKCLYILLLSKNISFNFKHISIITR